MPELCRFAGISVYMYCEPDSPHKLPHIHAEYQGQQVVVALDGSVLEGDLPIAQASPPARVDGDAAGRTCEELGAAFRREEVFQDRAAALGGVPMPYPRAVAVRAAAGL